MNGLEFVTRRTEKTGNSNDVVGREGKKAEATKRAFLPLEKLVGFMLFLATSCFQLTLLKV